MQNKKTSETLPHLWNAISVMAYSNKVYTKETQRRNFTQLSPDPFLSAQGINKQGSSQEGGKQPLC